MSPTPATTTATSSKSDDLILSLMAKVEALEKRLSDSSGGDSAGGLVSAPRAERQFKDWEEVITVEAIRDCTYPDVGDSYPKYRYAGKDGATGDIFRISQRDHLSHAMRELKVGETLPALVKKQIPQTAARGVRVTQQAH